MNELIHDFSELSNQMRSPVDWLQTEIGTAMWIDGLQAFEQANPLMLQTRSCQTGPSSATALTRLLLEDCLRPLSERTSVYVISDRVAAALSPFYRKIRAKFFECNLELMKKQSVEQCSFQPWTKRIELSAPHLTSHLGCDRIQYFAFNHEVCHTALFGGFYKRAPGETDQEIVENLMLIEWFCIASDFVLAQQIGSFNAGLRLIEELSNIEHDLSGPLEDRILKRTATNRAFGIEASEELKSCFLEAIQSPVANSPFEYTEQLIGRSTIDFHISFCSDNLMPRLPISDSVKLRSERRELTMKLKSMNVFELAELVC